MFEMGQPQNIVLETGQLDRLSVVQCQLMTIVVFLTVITDRIGIISYLSEEQRTKVQVDIGHKAG